MSTADQLLASIRRIEPRMTELVARERPSDDKNSIRVAVLAGLVTSSIAVLHLVSAPNLRFEVDTLVAKMRTLVSDTVTVRIDQVIIDSRLREEAKAQIMGANNTNASTALSLAYNICGSKDLQQMLSLNRGPMGPLGGVAAVLCQRLLPRDQAGNIFMDAMGIVSELMEALTSRGQSASNSLAPPKGSGCAIAILAVLAGAGGVVSAAVAVYQYLT